MSTSNGHQSTLRASTRVQDPLGFPPEHPLAVRVGAGAQKLERMRLKDKIENDALAGGKRWEPNSPSWNSSSSPLGGWSSPIPTAWLSISADQLYFM